MNYRRPFLLALACAACLLVAAILTTAVNAGISQPCHEDEPCWNWATMGNMDRGVFLRHGGDVVRVVDPCRFAYLDHVGRINWELSPRLKGDRLARRHGCDPRYFG